MFRKNFTLDESPFVSNNTKIMYNCDKIDKITQYTFYYFFLLNIKWMKILDIKYFNPIFMIYFNDSIVTCRINKDSTTIVNLF